MIGFGELRRLATQWRTDLANVERAYAMTRLVRGAFDHAILSRALALRASAALRYAHCPAYPSIVEPEFFLRDARDVSAELGEALRAASGEGVAFKLIACTRGMARIEFVGPLGRRSAAQPCITVSFIVGTPRLPVVHVPLLAPFSDRSATVVAAVACEELIAERVALFARSPRARDVFDAWFALTHTLADRAQVLALAREIAAERSLTLSIAALRHSRLARVWDNALRDAPSRPTFDQVIDDLTRELKI